MAGWTTRSRGRDDAVAAREVDHCLMRVQAERDSQTRTDDRTADAARLGAPDVRAGSLPLGT